MKKKKFNIGDKVSTTLLRSTGKKVKVSAKIKAIKASYGTNTYILTGGVVEDFPARNIK